MPGEKEGYQPSKEEIEAVEEHMTKKERNMSSDRELYHEKLEGMDASTIAQLNNLSLVDNFSGGKYKGEVNGHEVYISIRSYGASASVDGQWLLEEDAEQLASVVKKIKSGVSTDSNPEKQTFLQIERELRDSAHKKFLEVMGKNTE
jgi:hypothetical protein